MTTLDDLAKSTDVDVTRVCEIVSEKDQWDQMDNWQYEKGGQVKSWYCVEGAGGDARIREEKHALPDHLCDVTINCEPDHVVDVKGWKCREERKITKPELYRLDVVGFGNVFKDLYAKFPKVKTGGAVKEMMDGKVNGSDGKSLSPDIWNADVVNECIRYVKAAKKNEERIDANELQLLISKTEKVGQMAYEIAGRTVEDFVKFAINHVEDDRDTFAFEYIKMRGLNLAHDVSDTHCQFNCYYWTGKKWSINTAHRILQELRKLHIEKFVPNKGMAERVTAMFSADDATQQVDPDDEQRRNESRRYLFTSDGQVFDLETGELKPVDPEKMFSRIVHIKVKIADEESKLWKEFIDTHISPQDRKFMHDVGPAGWVHAKHLGTKRKATHIQGRPDTFKSVIAEVLKSICADDAFGEESMSGLIKNERWAKFLIRDKVWNVQEEADTGRIQSAKLIKDVLTSIEGNCEVKGGGTAHISRYPAWVVLCNLIQPIPVDDSTDAFFNRNQYLEMQGVEDGKDWRKLLTNPEELPKIVRTFLNRASEIHRGIKPLQVQNTEESKKRYKDLVEGDFTDYLKKHFDLKVKPTTGTRFQWILSHYNKVMPDKVKNETLTAKFAELGYEKKTRHWVYGITGEPNVFDEEGLGTDTRTQQTVIMGLKPKLRAKSATHQY